MSKVLEIKDYNFEEEVLLHEGEPVLVGFMAPWCGPCRMLAPFLEELAEEFQGKVKVAKVNVDESSLTATNYKVLSVPTLVFFKDGEMKEVLVGFRQKEELQGKLKEYIV
ncbi:thioredoxin [Candidatus Contubernalis alkaliaceticus]|uniref:thioredoxin n=1 Tax=Candidatus Contubernalis alkaliaceticus TaxID=338645 RepID=UPI001F4BFF7E|nr:thioredoxin [Candidatus Contubernalis alkalaceticus]UNC93392.1 thioredoxin [Candidatus Contubernalis alkalaceticus]